MVLTLGWALTQFRYQGNGKRSGTGKSQRWPKAAWLKQVEMGLLVASDQGERPPRAHTWAITLLKSFYVNANDFKMTKKNDTGASLVLSWQGRRCWGKSCFQHQMPSLALAAPLAVWENLENVSTESLSAPALVPAAWQHCPSTASTSRSHQ